MSAFFVFESGRVCGTTSLTSSSVSYAADLIDPELQDGRNAEVVHRHTEDVLICSLKFSQQLFRWRELQQSGAQVFV